MDILADLKREKPSNNTLYHYCSLENFMSIVESKNIYLSDVTQSNDYDEISWVFKVARQDCYEDNYPLHTKNIRETAENRHSFIRNDYHEYEGLVYGVCLSKCDDKLSQWRGYGDDGNGVAIGFDISMFAEDFCCPDNSLYPNGLYKVEYSREKLEEVISKLFNEIEPHDAQKGLLKIAPAFKNPSFYEEEEWRFIYTPKPCPNNCDEANGIKFRLKTADKIKTYFDFPLFNSFTNNPIKEVILGPKNRTSTSCIDLYLNKLGYKDYKVKKSASSYY